MTKIQERDGITRKSALRKFKRQAKAEAAKEARTAKRGKKAPVEPKAKLSPEEVSRSRKEGIRLYQAAGKPTPEQFRIVYGERGPKMTWHERA
ncbi:MAG TPA: hypothetical protein VJ731_12970 [Terriglobales bacterium]|nr:hypothetical protein [Terriglobales bacterium]